LTIASLTAVALSCGALGLSFIRVASWFSRKAGAQKLPAKQRGAA